MDAKSKRGAMLWTELKPGDCLICKKDKSAYLLVKVENRKFSIKFEWFNLLSSGLFETFQTTESHDEPISSYYRVVNSP